MNWITLSQFIFGAGTILLIRKIIIKREILNGYDLIGSFLTWVAMTFVLIQFYEWNDWFGLCAGLVQWIFWLFVIFFVSKQKMETMRERWKILGIENRKEFEKWCKDERK